MIRDLTLEQLVTERNIKESKKQTSIFKINRFVYVALCVLIASLVGRTLLGWSSLSKMLIESGAYTWLCTPKELSQPSLGELFKEINAIGLSKCVAQEAAVQSLFTTFMIVVMVASAFAGILMYYCGARITFMIGTLLMMSGWLILGYSNVNFKGHELGIVLISLGMDPVVFSLLSAGKLFPRNEMLVTGILAAATTVSSIFTTLFDYTIRSTGLKFSSVLTIYALMVHLLMIVFCLLYMPPRRFYNQEEIDEEIKRISNLGKIEAHFNMEEGFNKSSFISEVGSLDKIDTGAIEKRYIKPITTWMSFIKELKRIPIIITLLIIVQYVLIYSEASFIMVVMGVLLGFDSVSFLSLIIPFAFVPCLLLGRLADVFDVIYVVWYEAILMALTIFVMVVPIPYNVYMAPIFYTLCNACLISQFWFLIVEIYDPKIQMLMLGIINLVAGGGGALVCKYLYLIVVGSRDSILIGMYVFLGLFALQVVIITLIGIMKKKRKITSQVCN